MAQIADGIPPHLRISKASSSKLSTIKLKRTSHLVYQIMVVILLQVAVGRVAKNDDVQEPLQVALQPIFSTMHQLLSQPVNNAYLITEV